MLQRVGDVSGGVDESADLVPGDSGVLLLLQPGGGGLAAGLGLTDPLGDGAGIGGTGVEKIAVVRELAVTVADDRLGFLCGLGCGQALRGVEPVDDGLAVPG
ncbi:hypothetical protein [Streptomyces purpurogeneiscleroticus]|uniref:hypothetical protein n=1 Tax=Streptomyces purpurogeneiscleroticus TaxID=68259 RepID=UPI001CBDE4AE|nr:hypothetical protein [Streptomyces purpurogeneiscleroticus]